MLNVNQLEAELFVKIQVAGFAFLFAQQKKKKKDGKSQLSVIFQCEGEITKRKKRQKFSFFFSH